MSNSPFFISPKCTQATPADRTNRYLLHREIGENTKDLLCGVPIFDRNGNASNTRCENSVFPTFNGTNCKIEFGQGKINLYGKDGNVTVYLNETNIPSIYASGVVYNELLTVQATGSGAIFFYRCKPNSKTVIRVETTAPCQGIRKNNKYVAFMQKQFRPFFTVSSLYSVSENGESYKPLILESKHGNPLKQELSFSSNFNAEHINVFEINMYELKMIQDTTVESANETQNNAYGATAFIGNTPEFGEQWLYFKVNMQTIAYLKNKYISRATLYVPLINGKGENMQAFFLPSRFCSYGSNWNNKLTFLPNSPVPKSICNVDYVAFDITHGILAGFEKSSKESDGVLIMENTHTEFTLITTGDCYAFPHLLEVMYN